MLQTKEGTTLRSYLATKLDCDPARVSKKFADKSIAGNQIFHARDPKQPLTALQTQLMLDSGTLARHEQAFCRAVALERLSEHEQGSPGDRGTQKRRAGKNAKSSDSKSAVGVMLNSKDSKSASNSISNSTVAAVLTDHNDMERILTHGFDEDGAESTRSTSSEDPFAKPAAAMVARAGAAVTNVGRIMAAPGGRTPRQRIPTWGKEPASTSPWTSFDDLALVGSSSESESWRRNLPFPGGGDGGGFERRRRFRIMSRLSDDLALEPSLSLGSSIITSGLLPSPHAGSESARKAVMDAMPPPPRQETLPSADWVCAAENAPLRSSSASPLIRRRHAYHHELQSPPNFAVGGGARSWRHVNSLSSRSSSSPIVSSLSDLSGEHVISTSIAASRSRPFSDDGSGSSGAVADVGSDTPGGGPISF